MSGIVCKLWNISGNTQAKKSEKHLNDSLTYIMNDEKTGYSLEEIHMDSASQLSRECKYVENDLKTVGGAFVGVRNIKSANLKEAVAEMMEVKNFYEKSDGRTALHMMISLEEYESDISNAGKLMRLCDDVLAELFPDNQAVYAVHTNTDNLHVHVIINSVGLNGKKIHQDNNFIKREVHRAVNIAAKKYGFKQNDKWNDTKKYSKTDYVNLKIRMRKLIDDAIERNDNFDDFIEFIESRDIGVRYGKYLSLKYPDMDKAIRTYQLGKEYSVERIMERILLKKEPFELNEVGRYVLDKDLNIYHPNIKQMKKYKDMTNFEKKDVIHKLKMGKNPWRENSKKNWQLNKIANESNAEYRIKEYLKYYSEDGTYQGVLNGILEAKKKIEHEKAMIKYAKRKYKPIINIYNDMKKYERAAYLYEYCGVNDFRQEHEAYRKLTRKLKDGYGKEVFEVFAFLQECDERTLLASAQLGELSQQYLDVKRYGLKHGLLQNDKLSLLDVTEFYSDKDKFKEGTYQGGMNYIASNNSEYVMFISKSLYKGVKGYSLYYHIDIYDKSGKIVDTITEYNGKHFDVQLKELQKKYNFYDCSKFNEFSDAYEYINKHSTENVCAESAQNNHVDITISKKMVTEENDNFIKTRVPGMWGDNAGYLWIGKEDIVSIHNDKTILTFLDKDAVYDIYSEDNKIIKKMKGSDLYQNHYDTVNNNIRKHEENKITHANKR